MSFPPVMAWSLRGLALLSLSCALAVSPSSPVLAQIPSWGVDDYKTPPDLAWRQRALQDVDGAYRFLKENHPGAAPELHDTAFVARLEAAHALAAERAKSVDSPQGYNAVLAGFATDMGDEHISNRPLLVMLEPYWAGVVIGKEGDNWVVVATDQEFGEPPEGARLTSCDGVAAGELARRNLGGFEATWRIEAQQYQAAPWLLVDERNPFIRRPETCVFETAQGQQTIKLNWKRIKRENLIPKLKAAGGGGAAGFGIRKVGQGYWISLQDLMEKGATVATQVEARQAEIRAAKFVVVDVRGNGGGSSDPATRIAKVLWGPARTDEVLNAGGNDCDDVLRASPDNVADKQYLLKALDHVLSSEARAVLETEVAQGRDALAHGRAFSRPPVCTGAKAALAAAVKAHALSVIATPPKVILLTDNLCFSACLVLTDEFRRMGALHVGQTTNAATRYTDLREQYLPSGYSLFSTLQDVAPGEPPDVGPFRPDRMYNGDIADTPTLERWVLQQVGAPASR